MITKSKIEIFRKQNIRKGYKKAYWFRNLKKASAASIEIFPFKVFSSPNLCVPPCEEYVFPPLLKSYNDLFIVLGLLRMFGE